MAQKSDNKSDSKGLDVGGLLTTIATAISVIGNVRSIVGGNNTKNQPGGANWTNDIQANIKYNTQAFNWGIGQGAGETGSWLAGYSKYLDATDRSNLTSIFNNQVVPALQANPYSMTVKVGGTDAFSSSVDPSIKSSTGAAFSGLISIFDNYILAKNKTTTQITGTPQTLAANQQLSSPSNNPITSSNNFSQILIFGGLAIAGIFLITKFKK